MASSGRVSMLPSDVGSEPAVQASVNSSWEVIPQLLVDLTHAFDSLRLEIELLREKAHASGERVTLPAASPEGDNAWQRLLAPGVGLPCPLRDRSSALVTTDPSGPAGLPSTLSADDAPRHPAREPSALMLLSASVQADGSQPFPQTSSRLRPAQEECPALTSAASVLASNGGRAGGDVAPMEAVTHGAPHSSSVLLGQSQSAPLPPTHGQLLRTWDTSDTIATDQTTSHWTAKLAREWRMVGAVRTGDVVQTTSPLKHVVVNPRSKGLAVWDLLSVAALAVDLFLSPLTVFDFTPSFSVTLASATFWTMDIFVRCIVGYYDKRGILEMRPSRILWHYLKTGFIIDAGLVGADWAFIITTGGFESSKVLRFNKGFRFIRLARMIRFLRVVKMLKVFDSLERVQRSLALAAAVKVIKKVLFIVIINHFVACAWYGLSTATVDEFDTKGWSTELVSDRLVDEEPSAAYKYATALTQFTPASMEVHAFNTFERIFTIIVMIMSLLAFSSVVASMTSTMTELRRKNAEYNRQKELVSRFLSEHRISVNLALRVKSFMNHERVRAGNRPVLESQLSSLQSLPEHMKKDLHVEMFSSELCRHPVFFQLDRRQAFMVESVCHTAMRDEFFLIWESIWSHGDCAKKMMFVVGGSLHSFPDGSENLLRKSTSQASADATAGDILCEQALWLKWYHSGHMTTITEVSIFTLCATKFAEIVRSSTAVSLFYSYARLFLEDAVSERPGLVCDLGRANELMRKALDEIGVYEQPSSGRSPMAATSPIPLGRLIRALSFSGRR